MSKARELISLIESNYEFDMLTERPSDSGGNLYYKKYSSMIKSAKGFGALIEVVKALSLGGDMELSSEQLSKVKADIKSKVMNIVGTSSYKALVSGDKQKIMADKNIQKQSGLTYPNGKLREDASKLFDYIS